MCQASSAIAFSRWVEVGWKSVSVISAMVGGKGVVIMF